MASLGDDINSGAVTRAKLSGDTCSLRTPLRETRAALQLVVRGREGD
jgi:hypothetical protein